MKWLARLVLIACLATQQQMCWSGVGPAIGFAFWALSFLIVGAVEIALLETSTRVPLDEAERARRSFGRALAGIALTIPFIAWEHLTPIVLASIALRVARADVWRFAVPLALAAAAFVTLAVRQPTLYALERGNLLDWSFIPVGVLLVAHVGWLAWLVHRGRGAAVKKAG